MDQVTKLDVIHGIVAAIAVTCYYFLWRYIWIHTRTAPLLKKVAGRIAPLALLLAPSFMCGHGGCAPVPALFVLIDAVSNKDLRELFELVLAPMAITSLALSTVALAGASGFKSLKRRLLDN